MALLSLKTPWMQKIGGVIRQIFPETVAEQVKMADGTTVEARITNLTNAVAQQTVSYVVPTITDRDALATNANITLHVGDMVWVKDASADATVTSGAAKYILASFTEEGATKTPVWDKYAEAESMDLVIDWSMIQNKPTNSVANIDAAVTATVGLADHTLTVDDTTGNLKLDNQDVGRVYAASVSMSPEDEGFDAAVAALNLPEGAILTTTAAADTATEPSQQTGD